MSDKNKNLYYLDELTDYKVDPEYSDVRGWEVMDADNRTVGKVDRLLVNKKAERVVYLDVEVDKAVIDDGFKAYQIPVSEGVHTFLNKDGDNHLIIPIGMATLDEVNKKVTTNQISSSTFAKTKRFKGVDVIDFGYEVYVLSHYVGDPTLNEITFIDVAFYDRKEFKPLKS